MATDEEHLARIRRKLAGDGLTLVDTEWRGVRSRYRFRCDHGHESELSCEQLSKAARIRCWPCWTAAALREIHLAAERSGGRCLTESYIGKTAHYRFVCAAGHEFKTAPAVVLGGSWCKRCTRARCAERRRYDGSLKPLQDRARELGGQCLSTSYHGATAKYWFRCAQGHEWQHTGIEAMRAWCVRCFNESRLRPDGLKDLQQAAQRRGGVCLAIRYEGANHAYPFRCERGHEWSMLGAPIFDGAWCTKCRTDDRRQRGLEAMRTIAVEKGGKLVSDCYVDNNTKLEWECDRGHRWWARPRQITSGNWCRECVYLAMITNDKTRRKRLHEAAKGGDA